jgi:transcriptional regulator with XRE-family HTH domain
MSTHEAKIAAAIAELGKENANITISEVARATGIHRSTLSRRFSGITTSRPRATRDLLCMLSIQQEQCLVAWVLRLSKRKLNPTPRMIKQYAQAMVGADLGKNWTTRFIKRHESLLLTVWLPGIERARVIAEANTRCIRQWLAGVCLQA